MSPKFKSSLIDLELLLFIRSIRRSADLHLRNQIDFRYEYAGLRDLEIGYYVLISRTPWCIRGGTRSD